GIIRNRYSRCHDTSLDTFNFSSSISFSLPYFPDHKHLLFLSSKGYSLKTPFALPFEISSLIRIKSESSCKRLPTIISLVFLSPAGITSPRSQLYVLSRPSRVFVDCTSSTSSQIIR